jgi:hypothetical protein
MLHVFIQHTVQDKVTLLDQQIKIFHDLSRQKETRNNIYILPITKTITYALLTVNSENGTTFLKSL